MPPIQYLVSSATEFLNGHCLFFFLHNSSGCIHGNHVTHWKGVCWLWSLSVAFIHAYIGSHDKSRANDVENN